jgi:hypothetical protein
MPGQTDFAAQVTAQTTARPTQQGCASRQIINNTITVQFQNAALTLTVTSNNL